MWVLAFFARRPLFLFAAHPYFHTLERIVNRKFRNRGNRYVRLFLRLLQYRVGFLGQHHRAKLPGLAACIQDEFTFFAWPSFFLLLFLGVCAIF